MKNKINNILSSLAGASTIFGGILGVMALWFNQNGAGEEIIDTLYTLNSGCSSSTLLCIILIAFNKSIAS